MKPDYKNWVPKGMVISFEAGTVIAGVLFLVVLLTDFLSGTARTVAEVILGAGTIVLLVCSVFFINLYNTFSYDGKKQFARRIIDHVSDYVKLPENGVGLDIGCGSAALTIACAKKNPQGKMIGLDRWGKEYASFNMPLCENNAKIEGVDDRTTFVRGDACKLDYPDEYFDAVTSNYCYHNIPSKNRQEIILETMRVLKKGGVFAIHDEFTKSKYGDTNKLVQTLKDMGYEKVELLDTSDGLFMTKKEATPLGLVGSGLLVGRK